MQQTRAQEGSRGEVRDVQFFRSIGRWVVHVRFSPEDRQSWERVASIATQKGEFQVIERSFNMCGDELSFTGFKSVGIGFDRRVDCSELFKLGDVVVAIRCDRSKEIPMKLTIEYEQEADGTWIAEIPELSGVMVYGGTAEEAAKKAEILALRVLAERLEQGEGKATDISISLAPA